MGDEIDMDDEAERAFQAAMLAQGLVPGEGEEEEMDEAERAWQAAQMEAMKNASESGADDEDDFASKQERSSHTSYNNAAFPSHWEGFISHIEQIWDINFSDIKFGEQIGVGAFGSVHKGHYFGTEVAIKTVFTEGDETNMMYLQREINVLKSIRHPNIVGFIGISNDTTNSLLHIVTEYVQEGDLRGKLKDPKIKIPWDARARIAHDLASAMAYLHSRKILHRDLKSKNLLVDHNWRIKICDFGFARTCEKTKRPMTICGTEAWMAPEIILGQPYGASADVFSYGIVLCEIISRGKVSHTLTRKAEDGFGFSKEKFDLIVTADTPEDFKSAILEATAYEPERRPSFADLAEHFEILTKDLEAVVAEEKKTLRGTALEKFRTKAAALTVPLIEKGTIRERRNGLQRLSKEEQQPAVVVKAVPLREQKSTRRVQVPNQRVTTVHALIGGSITQSMHRNVGGKPLPPLGGMTARPPVGAVKPGAKPAPVGAKPLPGAQVPPAGGAKPAPAGGPFQTSGRGIPTAASRNRGQTTSNRPLPTPPPTKSN